MDPFETANSSFLSRNAVYTCLFQADECSNDDNSSVRRAVLSLGEHTQCVGLSCRATVGACFFFMGAAPWHLPLLTLLALTSISVVRGEVTCSQLDSTPGAPLTGKYGVMAHQRVDWFVNMESGSGSCQDRCRRNVCTTTATYPGHEVWFMSHIGDGGWCRCPSDNCYAAEFMYKQTPSGVASSYYNYRCVDMPPAPPPTPPGTPPPTPPMPPSPPGTPPLPPPPPCSCSSSCAPTVPSVPCCSPSGFTQFLWDEDGSLYSQFAPDGLVKGASCWGAVHNERGNDPRYALVSEGGCVRAIRAGHSGYTEYEFRSEWAGPAVCGVPTWCAQPNISFTQGPMAGTTIQQGDYYTCAPQPLVVCRGHVCAAQTASPPPPLPGDPAGPVDPATVIVEPGGSIVVRGGGVLRVG